MDDQSYTKIDMLNAWYAGREALLDDLGHKSEPYHEENRFTSWIKKYEPES